LAPSPPVLLGAVRGMARVVSLAGEGEVSNAANAVAAPFETRSPRSHTLTAKDGPVADGIPRDRASEIELRLACPRVDKDDDEGKSNQMRAACLGRCLSRGCVSMDGQPSGLSSSRGRDGLHRRASVCCLAHLRRRVRERQTHAMTGGASPLATTLTVGPPSWTGMSSTWINGV
jgi:hypothetical protein